MAAGEVSKRREGVTDEENETTTNVKRRKLEEVETRMILPPAVEEQCHQIPSLECDLLESVSCCSSNYRSDHDGGEFDQTETSWIYDNFNKRRDPEEEESVNIDSAAMELEEVESCRIKKQKKRCETVKEAEIEDFFVVAEKDVRNKMLECSSK
ncbi:Cyclin-dependent kinase inhibitor 2 [Hirschfeldia incana]|nr:Cyclin-dependent kinase inhibitor 2 [Hirschfeldia incana]